MKKQFATIVAASIVLGATSMSFAGAYGEKGNPEEMPAPVAAAPEEPATAGRLFSGYAGEAAVTNGIVGEIDSMYHNYDEFGYSADLVTTQARLSYGQDMWEVGAELPFISIEDSNVDNSQLGNLNLYGKVLPIRTDLITAGGGLQVSAPTSNSLFNGGDSFNWIANEWTPTDEWGFTPFLTAGTAVAGVNLRANIGYQVWDTDTNTYDNVTYNIGATYTVCSPVSLRTEIVGRHYVNGPETDPVSLVPGLDIKLPIEGANVSLRPTGMVGLADAPEWGLGLGVAVSQN